MRVGSIVHEFAWVAQITSDHDGVRRRSPVLFRIRTVGHGFRELHVANLDVALSIFAFRKSNRFSYTYDVGLVHITGTDIRLAAVAGRGRRLPRWPKRVELPPDKAATGLQATQTGLQPEPVILRACRLVGMDMTLINVDCNQRVTCRQRRGRACAGNLKNRVYAHRGHSGRIFVRSLVWIRRSTNVEIGPVARHVADDTH